MVSKNLAVWKNRLLDTSKRNQAIKFKPYRSSTIEIIHPDVEGFFDLLEHKRKLEFAELFQDSITSDESFELYDLDISESENKDKYVIVNGFDLKDKDVYSSDELTPVINSFKNRIKKSDKTNYIYTSASKRKQKPALINLMKRAKLAKEENAINVLYLAIGFLNWYDRDDFKVVNESPLVLVPVELERASLDAPIKINIQDPELQINVALVKAMEQDFGIHLDYDFDETKDLYTNYLEYVDFVKSRVRNSKWSMTDRVYLGLFSFSKISMYKDIEDNEVSLMNNSMIRALSGDLSIMKDNIESYRDTDLDHLIKPERFYQALDADSSQELAIQAAIAGKSFVLQGPPGTGKSQTITNMISELIARGKHVLFVAEKKAALDVVYQNLKKAGLEDYALPLHNAKIDKKTVVTSLNQSLLDRQSIPKINDEQLRNLSHNYQHSMVELRKYADELLKVRNPINLNVYQMIGAYLEYEDILDVRFDMPMHQDIDGIKLEDIKKNIEAFERLVQLLDPIDEHPFFGLKTSSMTLKEKERYFDLLNNLDYDINDLLEDIDLNFEGIDVSLMHFDNLLKHIEFLKHVTSLDQYVEPLVSLMDKKDANKVLLDDINAYKEIKSKYQICEDKIKTFNSYYDEEILDEPIDEYYRIIRAEQSEVSRMFSTSYKETKNKIKLFQKEKRLKHQQLLDDLSLILDSKKDYEKITKSLTKRFYKVSNVSEIDHAINILEQYHIINHDIYQKGIHLIKGFEDYIKHVFSNKPIIEANIQRLELKKHSLEVLMDSLKASFDMDMNPLDYLDFSKLSKKIKEMVEHKDELNDYLSLNQVVHQGDTLGLTDFYQVMIKNHITKDLSKIYYKRYYLMALDHIFQQTPVLNMFSRSAYDQYQKTYKKADKQMIKFAKYQIDQLIAEHTPSIDGIEGNNVEVITLRREANKSRRIKPIRRLFKEMPHLIMDLKPCLMMSPLSVSSFLKSTDYKFDTVIFDEASQVRPESALGAIYRSKQVIIVGDKEQLPPTSFFDAAEQDIDDDEVDANAFDSILELAEGVLKPISLKWHYRSKYEELIYVSNQFIYKDLITFPSRKKAVIREGIDFCYTPNGIFKDRINIVEAEKVAELVMEHVKTYGRDKTLGVVTFSQTQQVAVERAIEKLRRMNKDLESFFNDELEESFFVKNIETVQGDERDTMIISVGYARDAKGKLSMNFGPLNKEGGYRRLNVAVSRAKYNTILVSSIRDVDIDLNRTSAEGTRMLKEYLRFAEFGPDRNVNDQVSDNHSKLLKDVYSEIDKMGYKIDKRVGSSAYKIDLAVLHPRQEGHYILGIECDGSIYQDSHVSRDRDRLREDVLEVRGWKTYRIWSTDWLKHKDREVSRLKKYILNAIDDFGKRNPLIDDSYDEILLEQAHKKEKHIEFNFYPNYDDLYDKYKDELTLNAIQKILKETMPIHEEELKKIVPRFYGRRSYSSVVDLDFQDDLRIVKNRMDLIYKDGYYYQDNTSFDFRACNSYSSRRSFEHIHPLELRSEILTILEVVGQMSFDELLGEVIKYSGYEKSSKVIKEIFTGIITDLHVTHHILWKDEAIDFIKR